MYKKSASYDPRQTYDALASSSCILVEITSKGMLIKVFPEVAAGCRKQSSNIAS